MKRLSAAMAITLALVPAAALAWDDATHAHITNMAIDEVRDPRLKAFLIAHHDELISGVGFPDWGHAIKPHGEATHSRYLDVAFDDLNDPAVRAQPNYDRLVAHYMGVYAHVVEDRVLDATLKKHAVEVGEACRDDMENAILGIAGHHFLRRDFTPYVPAVDLVRIYARAGYFAEPRLNAQTLAPLMRQSNNKGMIQERLLKLLSFLGAGEMARVYPWGAANIVEATGGYRDNARAVAAGWEATWAQLHGRPTPFFVYSSPQQGGQLATPDATSPYGRITVVTRQRLDVSRLNSGLVHLVDSQGKRLPVSVFPYIDEPGHNVDVAFQIRADAAWSPGETYHLTVDPGPYAPARAGPVAPLQVSFSAPSQPLFTERARPPRPWAMGIFLFVLVGSVGALIAGAPDLLRLTMAEGVSPVWLRGISFVTRAVGGGALCLALVLLWSNGAAFLEWLHFNH